MTNAPPVPVIPTRIPTNAPTTSCSKTFMQLNLSEKLPDLGGSHSKQLRQKDRLITESYSYRTNRPTIALCRPKPGPDNLQDGLSWHTEARRRKLGAQDKPKSSFSGARGPISDRSVFL